MEDELQPINIFSAFPQATEKRLNKGRRASWINFVGPGKIGKTRFLVDAMKHLRILYIDCDPMQGTKPYDGTFWVCSDYEELEKCIAWAEYYKKELAIDIVVVDTLDGMFSLIERHYCKKHKTEDLKSIVIPGVGNGYSIAYNDFKGDKVSRIQALGKCLITVSHVRDIRMGKSDIVAQTKTQLDFPAGLTEWVHSSADTHLWMSMTMDEEHEKPYMRITQTTTDPYRTFEGGSRNYPGLYDVENEFKLMEYLITNYKD